MLWKVNWRVECVRADCIWCVWALMVLWVKVRWGFLQIVLCILQTRDLKFFWHFVLLVAQWLEHNRIWTLKEVNSVFFLKMQILLRCDTVFFLYCSLDGLDEWLQKMRYKVFFICFVTFVYMLILKMTDCIHSKKKKTTNGEMRVLP